MNNSSDSSSYIEVLKKRIENGDEVKAVIYARGRSDDETGENTCKKQIDRAKDYLRRHPNIILTGIYADDIQTSGVDPNRPEYNMMLKHLTSKGFDIVITQSLAKLNRDYLQSAALKMILVDKSATVYTLEDGELHDFNTVDTDLYKAINCAIDALHVKQLRKYAKHTHQLRIQRKELSAKDISYGYRWNKYARLIRINKDESLIIQSIFDMFVQKHIKIPEIQAKLQEKGISKSVTAIRNILRDERYIGHFYINKCLRVIKPGNLRPKQVRLPKDQWVLCERPDLQIVPTELFQAAQEMLPPRKPARLSASNPCDQQQDKTGETNENI